MTPASSPSFIAALHTDRPAPDRAEKLALYGQFIGGWEMDAVLHREDGTTARGKGAIHFGWVLEGRAVQDVWILPDIFYGTTLRVWDPTIDAWHILWSDPMRQVYRRMIGRAQGADIVQDGEDENGTPVRWKFTEITAESFHWIAERATGDGAGWQRLVDFYARRVRA